MTNDLDIALWPDGSWCYFEELHEMSFKSDDYEVIPVDTPHWRKLNDE